MQNKQHQEAADAWVTAYVIAKQIGYAQVLQGLKELAPQLGLGEGLDSWEQLAQRMQKARTRKTGEGRTLKIECAGADLINSLQKTFLHVTRNLFRLFKRHECRPAEELRNIR